MIEPPARIAVIGAGPTGLEAALYARYLGYQVFVYEQTVVCHQLIQAGEDLLPGNAATNRTSLGLAALQAQHGELAGIAADAQVTARWLWENYFQPLAQTDLLADSIATGSMVTRIERTDFPEQTEEASTTEKMYGSSEIEELEADEELEYAPFELTIRQSDGGETAQLAEVVIDARGFLAGTPINSQTVRIMDDPQANAESDVNDQGICTAEPNYFVLGVNAHGTTENFKLAAGHDQIRQLFAIIGGRAALNLYETFRK